MSQLFYLSYLVCPILSYFVCPICPICHISSVPFVLSRLSYLSYIVCPISFVLFVLNPWRGRTSGEGAWGASERGRIRPFRHKCSRFSRESSLTLKRASKSSSHLRDGGHGTWGGEGEGEPKSRPHPDPPNSPSSTPHLTDFLESEMQGVCLYR